jgi:hypothetical protein
MADGRGGYRRPANPAPASGPGALSQRTDGQPIRDLPDAQYGENASFREAQQGAPLPGSSTSGGAAPPPSRPVIGLGEPTNQPDTPVTAGADVGAGPGSEALGLPADLDKLDADEFARLRPMLIRRAQRDDTPKSVKLLIRRLLSS